MQSDTPQIFQPNLALLSLLTLGVVLGGIAAVVFVVASRRSWSQIAQAYAKFCVVMIAVLVVAGFFWGTAVSVPHSAGLKNPGLEVPTGHAVSSSASRVVSTDSVTSEAESIKSDAALPEWTRQAMRIDGRQKLIVVSSGRFASEQEAERHGYQQAAVIAAKEYSSLDPRGIGAVQPQHADLIKDNAIKRQFPEVTQHDFGKFQAPMHQLWLEVAMTPELGERLAEPWRQAAVDARLRTLGGWGLWGTVAAALAAFGLRLDSAWNGKRRAVIGGAVAALALGSLAFLV